MSIAPVIYVVEPFGGSIRRHNANLPLLFADDLGVTRGDGIFEAMRVEGGQAHNMERHLERFRRSAEALDLPLPTPEKWQEATKAALEEWGETEGKCTWTLTRGRASTSIPTGWVAVEGIDAETLREREKGVKAITMERTWQLPTEFPAKTVNYAATMAALRYAKKQDAQDVIYLNGTGLVLEGSRSSVVTTKGRKLRTPAAPGILPGTTQAAIFACAEAEGWRCKRKEMNVDYLLGADSVWLVSSTRGPVRVTHLNGQKLPKPANVEEIRELMRSAL